ATRKKKIRELTDGRKRISRRRCRPAHRRRLPRRWVHGDALFCAAAAAAHDADLFGAAAIMRAVAAAVLRAVTAATEGGRCRTCGTREAAAPATLMEAATERSMRTNSSPRETAAQRSQQMTGKALRQ
ncbi:unnamed protein product, partial [Urochloa humidicola]